MTTLAHPANAGFSPVASTSLFGDVVRRVKMWREVRQTRIALSKLSDRELNDIGLLRHQIGLMSQDVNI